MDGHCLTTSRHGSTGRKEARGEAKGKVEGEIEGEIKGLREGFVDIVETRFPDLAEIAEERVTRVTEANMLRLLLKAVVAASDETAAQKVLDIILVA